MYAHLALKPHISSSTGASHQAASVGVHWQCTHTQHRSEHHYGHAQADCLAKAASLPVVCLLAPVIPTANPVQVMLSSGGAAMRANLKALGQGVSAQVHQAMANPERLIARTQLVGLPAAGSFLN